MFVLYFVVSKGVVVGKIMDVDFLCFMFVVVDVYLDLMVNMNVVWFL